MRARAVIAAVSVALAAGTTLLAGGDGTATTATPAAEAGPARLDYSRSRGRDAPFLRGFDYAALARGASIDAIPAIDRPTLEDPDDADLLRPSSLVVGLEVDGDARAYPTTVLSLHEIVNDVVGGVPVALTWCPLCSTALAYERRVGGRTLTFGVSGLLYHRNLILFDRETGSLWSQLLGGALTGRFRGTRLRALPVVHVTWQAWRREHPDTRVLSIRQDVFADRFVKPSADENPLGAESSDQPYGSYVQKVPLYYRRVVRSLPDSEPVLGLRMGDAARAYRLALLRKRLFVQDFVSGWPVLVVAAEDGISAVAFSRRVDGRTLSFGRAGRLLLDRQTGSRWSTDDGRALAGPLAGMQLTQLPATRVYWFAWRTIFPNTTVAGLNAR